MSEETPSLDPTSAIADAQPVLAALALWEKACLDAGLSSQTTALVVMRIVESNGWFGRPPRRQLSNHQRDTIVRRCLRDGVETVAGEERISVNTLERWVLEHQRREGGS